MVDDFFPWWTYLAAFLVEDVKDTSCEQRFPLPSLKWSHSNWSTRRTTGPLRIVATTSLPRLRRQNSGQAPSNRCFHVFPGVQEPPATKHNKTPPVGVLEGACRVHLRPVVTTCVFSVFPPHTASPVRNDTGLPEIRDPHWSVRFTVLP